MDGDRGRLSSLLNAKSVAIISRAETASCSKKRFEHGQFTNKQTVADRPHQASARGIDVRITWLGFLAISCCLLITSCNRGSSNNSQERAEPAGTGSVEWTTPDAEQIEALGAAHAAVRDRLVAEQWSEAAALFSDEGVARFERLHQLALHGDREALAQLGAIDLLYVLLMRNLNEPEQLRNLSPREMVAWALENKMLGPHWREGDEVVDLEVTDGTRARGKRVYQNGHPSNLQVFFDREAEGWRVSLDGEFLKQEEDFQILANDPAAASPAELATTIYEVRTMSKLTPDVFDPPFPIAED